MRFIVAAALVFALSTSVEAGPLRRLFGGCGAGNSGACSNGSCSVYQAPYQKGVYQKSNRVGILPRSDIRQERRANRW